MQDELQQDAAAIQARRGRNQARAGRSRAGRVGPRGRASVGDASRQRDEGSARTWSPSRTSTRRPGAIASPRRRCATAKAALGRRTTAACKSPRPIRTRRETLFAYTRITAPFAGVITHRYADTGAMIQAGTSSQTQAMPIVKLSQNSVLRLTIPVPESAVPRIHLGTPVTVTVASLGKTVSRHGRAIRRQGRRADADDADGGGREERRSLARARNVRLGGADARREEGRADGVRLRPSIAPSDDAASVLVVDANGKLQTRRITLGLETPNRIEVLSGLQEDDLVVLGNRSQLKAGSAVTPKLDKRRRTPERNRPAMSRFSIRNPYLIIVICLMVVIVGHHLSGAHAGRSVSDHQPARGRRRDVVQRHAARGDRDGDHRQVRAVLHAGQRHRPHGVAVAAGRERHQGVLPARDERRFRRQQHLEPGDGRSAAAAAGNDAADHPEVRRVEPAGLPGHAEGRRAERGDAAGRRTVQRAESAGGGAGRVDPAAVRRQVPADHGLRRSGEAAGLSAEPDGRGARGEQREPHPAGRRRQDRRRSTTRCIRTASSRR